MREGIIDIGSRYDQFQAEAVANILNDYRDKLAGRFLLVIPTGGGKTFTAVKALNKLFDDRVLNPDSDRVDSAGGNESPAPAHGLAANIQVKIAAADTISTAVIPSQEVLFKVSRPKFAQNQPCWMAEVSE